MAKKTYTPPTAKEHYTPPTVEIKKKKRYTSPKIKEVYASPDKGEFKTVMSLFSLILMVLLVAMLFRKFTGNKTIPTFTSFLEMLTSIETPTIPFSDFSFTAIASDWGIFDFLKNFLNMFVAVFNVLVFLANGLITLGSYVGFFVTWLFA